MKTKLIVLIAAFLTLATSSALATSTIVTWMKDMYNQIYLKPQEKGMMMTFPKGVVSVDGRYYGEHQPQATWQDSEKNPATMTKNPVAASNESIQEGKKIFNIYCAACHGRDGMGNTPVSKKGIPPFPIKVMTPNFTDGHIYKKIRYGGTIMPPFGYATSEKERWNIVNYVRYLEKAQ